MMKVLRWIVYIGIDFLSAVLYPLFRLLNRNRFRILVYHSIRDISRDVKFNFNVTPAAFAQQMEFLVRNKNNVISLDELIDCKYYNKILPPKSVIITFDDGYADNYINAFPILARYNLKATIFLVTDHIGGKQAFDWLKLDRQALSACQEDEDKWLPLDRQHICDMQGCGISFGAHTRTHCALDKIEGQKARDEIEHSKKHLEDVLSEPVVCFSYPYNRMNEKIKGLVKEAGYKIAVAGTGANTIKSDFLKLKRIEIQRGDSINKFARKVNGAYDWIEYPLSIKILIKRLLSGRWRNNHWQKN